MKQKTATTSLSLSDLAIEGLREIKGVDIVRMNLKKVSGAITDYFIICTGTSDRHVQSLARSVEDTIREETGEKPLNVEGMDLGQWVLLDYVNVVVHVFQQEKRIFYGLEEMWGDADIERIAS